MLIDILMFLLLVSTIKLTLKAVSKHYILWRTKHGT